MGCHPGENRGLVIARELIDETEQREKRRMIHSGRNDDTEWHETGIHLSCANLKGSPRSQMQQNGTITDKIGKNKHRTLMARKTQVPKIEALTVNG